MFGRHYVVRIPWTQYLNNGILSEVSSQVTPFIPSSMIGNTITSHKLDTPIDCCWSNYWRLLQLAEGKQGQKVKITMDSCFKFLIWPILKLFNFRFDHLCFIILYLLWACKNFRPHQFYLFDGWFWSVSQASGGKTNLAKQVTKSKKYWFSHLLQKNSISIFRWNGV